jgi:glycosyltransferase involved in cell wall biosynthesis
VNSVQDSQTGDLLVSVGIPTYNRPDGLRRTLECITRQTYQNLEIIVSDNCSPGLKTEAVVREFMAKDPRIKYYRQAENLGASNNFKFVLEKATGEYFMWAADDDEWDLDYIEELWKRYKDHHYVLTSCGCKLIDKDDNLIPLKTIPHNSVSKSQYDAFLVFLLSHHWAYCKANLIYGLYKRETIKNIPLGEYSLAIGDDILFLLRVISKGSICYFPEEKMTKHLSYTINLRMQYKNFNPISSLKYLKYVIFNRPDPNFQEIDKYCHVIDTIIDTSWSGKPAKILKMANKINKLRLVQLF